MKQPCTYILTNSYNTVLYVGVTNNIVRRTLEHKERRSKGFTKRYNVDKLVYFEQFATMIEAIRREKQLKHQNRAYKVRLIQMRNAAWIDLFPSLLGDGDFQLIVCD